MNPAAAAAVSKTVEPPPRAEAPETEAVGSARGEGEFPRALDERVDAAQKRSAEDPPSGGESPRKAAETRGSGEPARAAAKPAARDADAARAEHRGETSDAMPEAEDLESALEAVLATAPEESGDRSGDSGDAGDVGESAVDRELDDALRVSPVPTRDGTPAPVNDPGEEGMADAELLATAASSGTELETPAARRAARAAPPRGDEARARVERQAGGEPPREAARSPEAPGPSMATPEQTPEPDSTAGSHTAHDRPPRIQPRAEAQPSAPPAPGDPQPAQATPAQTLQLHPAIAAPGATPSTGTSPTTSSERSLPELPVRNENEIVRTARVLAHQNGGEARIVLHPPQLGELGMRLIVSHDVAHLSLSAEHQGVAQLLARHLPELRAALEVHQIRLERVDVDVRGDPDGSFGRASQRGAPDEEDAGGRGPRGRLRAGSGRGGSVLPPLRGATPHWAHLGTVDLRI